MSFYNSVQSMEKTFPKWKWFTSWSFLWIDCCSRRAAGRWAVSLHCRIT